MQAIEFEAQIDKDGHISLPKRFQHVYGQSARMLVLLPDVSDPEVPDPLVQQRRPGSAKGILKILSEDDEHLDVTLSSP